MDSGFIVQLNIINIEKMEILVTGSEGFIGSHLVPYLMNEHHSVIRVDKKIYCDVLDLDEDDIKHADVVIHLAAQTSVWNNDLEQIAIDNIQAFTYIFNLCRKLRKRFIYASSSCAYNVTSAYGLSKYYDEQLAHLYSDSNCVGLRLHNVYGKNPRPDTLLGVCMSNDSVELYNEGKNKRHFTYIDDVCRVISDLCSRQEIGLYNVFNPEVNTTYDFAAEVKKYKDLHINRVPMIRAYDKVVQEVEEIHCNPLKFDYTSIEEGIRKVFEK